MKIRVLGSAAGGSFPSGITIARTTRPSGRARSGREAAHSSIAVRGASRADAWALVNASPDLSAQLHANADLQPGRAIRDTALSAIVLVDGQVDHTTGLYMLREASTLAALVYRQAFMPTSREAIRIQRAFPLLRYRSSSHRSRWGSFHRRRCGWREVGRDRDFGKARAVLAESGVACTRWHIAAFHHGRSHGPIDSLRAGARCDRTRAVWKAMLSARCVLVDGTFWTGRRNDPRSACRAKHSRDIDHLPQSGPGGMPKLARSPSGADPQGAHPHQQHQPDPR